MAIGEATHFQKEDADTRSLREGYYGILFPTKAQDLIANRGQISAWQLAVPQGEYFIPSEGIRVRIPTHTYVDREAMRI